MENLEEINPIQEWIENDSRLSNILIDIEKITASLEEQAEIAFHRISEEYNLPKMPQDIDYENDFEEELTSVYQNLGILKYTYPNDDPRSNLMAAIYCCKECLEPNMEDFWIKANEEGYNQNNVLGIGYLGDNYNVKIKFVLKGENWHEAGYKFFVKFD